MVENPLNPENIPGADKAEKQAVPTPKSIPKASEFQSYMEEGTEGAGKAGGISPMELAAGEKPSLGTPTAQTLLNQVHDAQSTLSDVQTKLSTPKLQLKKSQEQLLDNKFAATNKHIEEASKVAKAPVLEHPEMKGKPSVVDKFINYVNNGQNQLLQAKKQLEDIKEKGENLKPGELLLIQVNLSQAQQAIEYSSVLLSKAVDAIKQTINIQI